MRRATARLRRHADEHGEILHQVLMLGLLTLYLVWRMVELV